jgi:LPXTG-motif cell wall-anchored protein
VKFRLAVAALLATGAALVLPATAAHAQCPTSAAGGSCAAPPTDVGGTGGSSGEPAAEVAATQSPTGTTSLPLTGGDVAGLSVIGIGLLAGGTVLVRRARVRTPGAND